MPLLLRRGASASWLHKPISSLLIHEQNTGSFFFNDKGRQYITTVYIKMIHCFIWVLRMEQKSYFGMRIRAINAIMCGVEPICLTCKLHVWSLPSHLSHFYDTLFPIANASLFRITIFTHLSTILFTFKPFFIWQQKILK